jgi:hypothetical protein
MPSIWKYQLEITDNPSIVMPVDAKILTVQVQDKLPCLWVMIPDNHEETETRHFRLAGTGHLINEASDKLSYIGTFQLQNDTLVFHVFEVIN